MSNTTVMTRGIANGTQRDGASLPWPPAFWSARLAPDPGKIRVLAFIRCACAGHDRKHAEQYGHACAQPRAETHACLPKCFSASPSQRESRRDAAAVTKKALGRRLLREASRPSTGGSLARLYIASYGP